VVDVSKSMNTNDIKTESKNISRLKAVKQIIKDYIINNKNNKYSLSVFA
jgi:hypothetical protein